MYIRMLGCAIMVKPTYVYLDNINVLQNYLDK